VMREVYDMFFESIAAGDILVAPGKLPPDIGIILDTSANEEKEAMTKLLYLGARKPTTATSQGEASEANGYSIDADGPFYAVITKADDPRVALYRPKSVRDHNEYHEQMRSHQAAEEGCGEEPTLHGGRRAMVRMLESLATTNDGARSSTRPLSFLTTRDLAMKVLAPEYRERCPQVPVYVAEKDLLDTIRGQKLNAGDAVLAMVQFPIASPLSDLIGKPPILVLEDVRYADNVGSILRTAFCLGITSVVASHTSWAALRDSRAARCSMGTIYYHKFYKASENESLAKVIGDIRLSNITVYGVEICLGSEPLSPHGGDRMWAAVLGNEDVGLSRECRDACDRLVFVPQAHGDSINVGHAAAITLFELGREVPTAKHDGRASCI